MNPLYYHIKQRLLSSAYEEGEAASLAKWILAEVFDFSMLELYTGKDTNFPQECRERLDNILTRLERFEPIQYIIGEVQFCGLDFKVTPAVLIPRPETAELVEWIAGDCSCRPDVRVLDIGTGSGCIAVSLASRLEEAKVTAWDISPQALSVARQNAQVNRVAVDFCEVDVLQDDLPELTVDVLVSNPPYIAERERVDMERNVLDYEPELALFVPDDDPLLFYRRIAHVGKKVLVSGGNLYFEINRAYGKETADLLESLGYHSVELRKDLLGNNRMIKAIKP